MNDDRTMVRLLDAKDPDPDRRDGLMLFGQFVGSWDIDATYWDHDGNVTAELRGEWHFGWVLQGRAIQDVLISPRRGDEPPLREYGSSFRLYDPKTDTWRVTWFAPVSGTIVDLTGGAVDDRIVLEGVEPNGTLARWEFSDIEPDAFTWTGHESTDRGDTWPLIERMRVRRRASDVEVPTRPPPHAAEASSALGEPARTRESR